MNGSVVGGIFDSMFSAKPIEFENASTGSQRQLANLSD
jgi:hypothetical protein